MDFHIAEQICRITRNRGNRCDIMTGRSDDLTHADAVTILQLQQIQVKLANHGVTAQEGTLETHAFFLREADDFNVEGQGFTTLMQVTHDRNRHQNAFTTVIFAAIAHGIVMRAGEQGLGLRIAGQIATDNIAHGINLHLHASLAHPLRQLCRGTTVGLGQIGAGQGAFIFAQRTQLLGPFHDGGTQRRAMSQQIIEAHFCDATDLAQRFL